MGQRHDDIDSGKVVSFIAGGLAVAAAYLLGKLLGAVLGW